MRMMTRVVLPVFLITGLAACGGGGDTDNTISGSPNQPAPGNSAPTISFDQPATGSTLTAGDTAHIVVNATDSDGTVQSVQLTMNGSPMREDTEAPFEWGAPGSNDDASLRNLAAGG